MSDKWISVEDRLPINAEEYLCYVKRIQFDSVTYFMSLLYFNMDVEPYFSVDFDGDEVTHWRLLPEAPNA